MSTQLILYPQSYGGVTTSLNEFVIDGINFRKINASTSYSTVTVFDTHLITTPPGSVNTWYRWRNTASGTPAYPLETGGDLVINAVSPTSISGVYQELSSLSVGVSYTLTVNFTSVAGLLNLRAYNGSTLSLITGPMLTTVASQQTINFIAQTTNDIIAILYYNTGATDLTISSISLLPTASSPSGIYSDLQDGQVICDLYQEEDIPLTLSVDDFKNVAEQVKSYSKDFNLPATKRNNQIFNNMFEITRADDGLIFNPYAKTQCVLKEDGFILFEGYLRLIDVKDKDGEISYNVNLYSEVIALADTLKDRTFADLDFSELEHDYNYTNIRESWIGNLPLLNPLSTSSFAYSASLGVNNTGVLKYPFIDWNHQFYPSATNGFPVLSNLEAAFRPCIRLKYLINKIFAASGFNWTSSFFDSADFDKLYMDFNWGSNDSSTDPSSTGANTVFPYSTTSYVNYQLDIPNTFTSDLGYDDVNHRFVAPNDNTQYNLDIDIAWKYWISGGSTGMSARIAHRDSGGTLINTYNSFYDDSSGFPVYNVSQNVNLQQNDTLQVEWKSNDAGAYSQYPNPINIIIASIGSGLATTNTILQNLRGELGQWDFLKGIMTMFNLVSMVDENDPNNILIEPYSDVFIKNTNSSTTSDMTLASRSIEHDWTDKIDASQMELKPLTDLNKNTIFQFVEDDDDYAFNVYKNSLSGHLYGSKELDASTSTNGLPTILHGTKEIIAEPFAATVSKPLMSQYSDFIVPAIYAMNEDDSTEGFENSPRIFYDNYVKTLASCTYFVPKQNGVLGDATEDEFLQFSHLTTIPSVSTTTTDFVFESQQLLPGVGNPPTDNLYFTYWQPYFNELYNADTRTMTLKVNLTPADINTFKFYDTVFIKNRSFRVNKIEYKPNDLATVEFILIP